MMSGGESRLYPNSSSSSSSLQRYQLNVTGSQQDTVDYTLLGPTISSTSSSLTSKGAGSSFSRSSSSSSTCSTTSSNLMLRRIPYEPNPSPPATAGGLSSDESLQEDSLSIGEGEGDLGPLTGDQKRMRRMQANKRERKRMHTVNSAFDDLRDLVPTYPSNRKLSKIETLRLACAYIEDLAKLLRESTGAAVVHGEDVNLHHPHLNPPLPHNTGPDTTGFLPPPRTYSPIKNEYNRLQSQDYSTCNFQHYRVPLSYDYESCPSDPEIQSPPTYRTGSGPPVSYMSAPGGLAVKPPALARVSSDTAVSLQMAQTSLNTSSSGYCGSPSVTPCSPLTRVQHSTPSAAPASLVSRNLPSSHFLPSSTTSNYYHHHSLPTPGFTQCYSQ